MGNKIKQRVRNICVFHQPDEYAGKRQGGSLKSQLTRTTYRTRRKEAIPGSSLGEQQEMVDCLNILLPAPSALVTNIP